MSDLESTDDSTKERLPRPPDETGRWGSPNTREPALPERIGRYEIRQLVGAGASDRVYLAYDPELGRSVALKVPKMENLWLSDQRYLRRFHRPARAAGAIHHPNVCPVYEIGTADGVPYVTMPYYPLGNLRQWIKNQQGQGSIPTILGFAREIALGLSAAHANNILHCDLKPTNVLLGTARGEAVVTDFARFPQSGDDDFTEGSIYGTPLYMTPEVARGLGATLLSDISSFGCVLYEMLTGQVPFRRETIHALLIALCEDPPVPPSSLRSGLDPRIDALCLKCLEKKPENRYQSAQELADAIAAIQQPRAVPVASPQGQQPEQFGRFEVRKVLGHGAFGRVLLAYDPVMKREVAVKHPYGRGLSPKALVRFQKEAWATARINHPNVCQVYEAEVEGSVPYIVMRYVAGGSLADLLDKHDGPLPPRTALAIARKLALGLAAAHAQGLIHRDLKPANVLYDKANREVLISDFGLAHFIDLASETRGDGKGTPSYMSPEQWNSERFGPVTPQSDIYSLGVILYELLTGDVPFGGRVDAVGFNHCHTPIRLPSVAHPVLGTRFDDICRKAMAKNAAERHPSAQVLAKELSDCLRRENRPE